MDDLNNFGSLALGSRSLEQLRVVDDVNNLGSREFKTLDATNNS